MARHLFSIVSGAVPGVLDWIAYHQQLGFDRLCVFSSPSATGARPLLAALAAAGEIDHQPLPVPDGVSARDHARAFAAADPNIVAGDWLMWLGPEDYLAIDAGRGGLDDLLSALPGETALAIGPKGPTARAEADGDWCLRQAGVAADAGSGAVPTMVPAVIAAVIHASPSPWLAAQGEAGQGDGCADVALMRHHAAVSAGAARLRAILGGSQAVGGSEPDDGSDTIANTASADATASTQDCATPVVIHGFTLTMPDEAVAAVTEAYRASGAILEYGSGGSTFLALEGGARHVMTVESDRAWADEIRDRLSQHYDPTRFHIHHADIGRTRAWGYSAEPERSADYHRYALSVWDQPWFVHPDTVLIDGRFRTACFVATMLRCTRPVTVLFDDYLRRDYYHWVEAYFPRAAMHGRMARFNVEPRQLPVSDLTRIIGAFTDQR